MHRLQSPHEEWRLTNAEDQVLRLIAEENMTDREIAAALQVSVHTVKTHVRNILQKMGVPNRREAARLYRRSL